MDEIEGYSNEAAVVRSALDDKVWFASLPGSDIMTSEGHCSTSARKVKAYVEDETRHALNIPDGVPVKWVRSSPNCWDLHVKEF